MSIFSHLIRFQCQEDGQICVADLGPEAEGPPALGTQLVAYGSVEQLATKTSKRLVTIQRVSYVQRNLDQIRITY